MRHFEDDTMIDEPTYEGDAPVRMPDRRPAYEPGHPPRSLYTQCIQHGLIPRPAYAPPLEGDWDDRSVAFAGGPFEDEDEPLISKNAVLVLGALTIVYFLAKGGKK